MKPEFQKYLLQFDSIGLTHMCEANDSIFVPFGIHEYTP